MSVPDPARVLIVDDQALFAQGLGLVLNAQEHLSVLPHAVSGHEALVRIPAERPDVVLLDLRMPGLGGIEVLRQLRVMADPTPVIVLTTLRLERALYEALQAGAVAFVTKDVEPQLLIETIDRVLAGDTAVGAPELHELLGRHGGGAPSPAQSLPELTDSERAVFLLCARGLTNAQIAQAQFVTIATVKSHIAAILRKLRLENRVQVTIYAYENGLTRPLAGG